MATNCPTIERLAGVLRGGLPNAHDEELAAHLSECAACQAQLETLAGATGWLKIKARTHTLSSDSESLRRAMQALESRADASEKQSSTLLKLDFLEPADKPDTLGRFGPYEVVAHIASGGMGTVLKARDPALDRIVALKILPPGLAASALARARFVREGRAAAAVVHENVVPIYAVDECNGLPYLVMQFVQGRSLSERIGVTGSLRLEEILRIGVQTAAGLAAAHAQGLVHRDVKPGNILLENSVERVKLTDFGLARAADDAGLTRTGELAGTPEFMAPEQASSGTVDHRADLFSFGSVLYAMCTGHSPFQSTSVIAVLRRVCDEQPPPVHEINSSVPRWLGDIIAKLMAKSPAERFQSAQEVCELLERYLARVQRGELGEIRGAFRPPRRTARLRQRAIVCTGSGLALALVLFFWLKHSNTLSPLPPASPQEEFTVHDESGVCVGGFANLEDALNRMPAGGIVELRWSGSREMRPLSLPAKRLTLRAARGFQPVWNSPDETTPALTANASLSLEGVRFVMASRSDRQSDDRGQFRPNKPRVPPSGLALLSITNGPLRVTDCTFDARTVSAPERACIVLTNVSACRIENSMLFAPPAKAVVWQRCSNVGSPSYIPQLTLSNCIGVAGQVLWLDLPEPSQAQIEIVRCTFYAAEAFCVFGSIGAASLGINSRGNVFDTGFMIFDGRNPASPPLRQWVRWTENDNLYSPEQRHEQRYVVGIALKDGPARLSDWNLWWNQTGANGRQVQISYANGWNDRTAGRLRRVSSEPRDFRITKLEHVAGPPLERDQWQLFGANTGNVGPPSK